MSTHGSADLTLRFERSGCEYRVQEVDGSATSSFAAGEVLPFLPEGGAKRSSGRLTPQDVKSSGKQLFAALFQYEILARLTSAREEARSAQRALRLQIDLEGALELDDLPWELLADPTSADNVSILRCIPSPALPRGPALAKPLRVLAILSSPADLPPFDVAQKWEDLELGLRDLTASGSFCCERLEEASEGGLRSALAQGSFQVLHFVGYGRSNVRAKYGSLSLEGQDHRSRAIAADYLAGLLGQHPAARLAVLDAVVSTGELNPFAEMARVLVRNGLAAVVAMRRRLSSAATATFCQELYSSLTSGLSIEQSVTNTRRALAQRTLEVEWDAPMLYISPGNGILFQAESPRQNRRTTRDVTSIHRPPVVRQPGNEPPAGTTPTNAQTQLDRKRVRRTKILLLAASPEDLTGLRLGEEFREIDAGLRRAKYRQRFQLEHRLAVRPLDLQQAMLDFEPHIVHFCGHGAGADGLILEDNNGLARPVPSSALANLFRLFSNKVECVVLNSCHTEDQAKAISEHIHYVVGMKRTIEDRAAINFAIGFYCALGAGHPIDFAYESGRSAIELDDLPGNLTPALLVRPEGIGG
ncbi:MAG TPA: CHAT domain-containing protein [Thermoanaerobaculia bacterium]|nr:CHAT domain-containing protein [Thermoanaerobaculia bacterium]